MGTSDVHESRAAEIGEKRDEGHAGHKSNHGEPMSPEDAVRSLLILGQVALDAGDYESAVEAYASLLQIEPNEVALYNLGSFYARGLGVKRDYVEAARLFHQAELLGNDRACRLCAKCMFDHICHGLGAATPAEIYATMAVFVARVYPEAGDQRQEASNGLVAIAGTLLGKGLVEDAGRVFTAAAEFGDSEYARRCLDELDALGE